MAELTESSKFDPLYENIVAGYKRVIILGLYFNPFQRMTPSKLVIYVDDDHEDRMIMEDAFINIATHHLMTLPHGNKLLDYLAESEQPASLIILDINMPFLSGLDVLRLLKSESRYRNIPVVMFTTSSSSDDAMKAKEYGADLIVKPASYREAVSAIAGLLSYSL